MPIEDFIIAVFCCVELMWQKSPIPVRLRQQGSSPKLSDAEVITMEIVGELLGFVLIGDIGFQSLVCEAHLPDKRRTYSISSNSCIRNWFRSSVPMRIQFI